MKGQHGTWGTFIKIKEIITAKRMNGETRNCVGAEEIEVLNDNQCRRITGLFSGKEGIEFSVQILARVLIEAESVNR